MKKYLRTTLVALVATGVAGSALADSPKSSRAKEKYQRKLFAQLDSDSDGKLTEREFAVAVLWDEFAKYDADKDGRVTKAEYEAQEKTKNIWAQLDRDGNGSFTFGDCFDSKQVVDELRAEWRSLTSKLGKGKEGVRFITLEDLPDLTP